MNLITQDLDVTNLSLGWLPVIILLAITASSSAQPVFRPLGFAPNETQVLTAAVSSDGRTVAGFSRYQIFRWTEESGFQFLGAPAPPYNNDPVVTDLSGDGTIIIGCAHDSGHKGYPTGAFIWTEQTGIEYLGPPDDVGTIASAISEENVVYGRWHLLPDGPGTYTWTPTNGFTRLPGAITPVGVSDDGRVIVGAANRRWTAEGGIEFLGDLPGGSTGGACVDASYDGSVVIGQSQSANCNPSFEFEAYRWTRATGMVGLGALPAEEYNYFWSHPHAVSADGSVIVGESIVSATPYRLAAFIWRDDGRGMRKLQDVLIEDYGLGKQLEGWNLWSANDISPDGQYIVGGAIDPEGRGQAYLVRIPTPCTADFNHDSLVNSDDFFAFLAVFFTACESAPCPADFNHDGFTNSQDFFDYLSAFFAGC